MKKNVLLGTLIAATVFQSSTPAFAGREEAGNIIGGIIGGVIGSQIGGGSGKTAATIIGTIAGSMIGGDVGRDLDEADHRALSEAQRDCLEGDIGSSREWSGSRYGSRSGARGRFMSTREGYNHNTGEYCREYESAIYSRRGQERTVGVACSRNDGSWYESRREDLRYDGPGLDRHRPGHGRPGYGRPGHGRPGYGRPGHGPGRPGHGRPPGYPPPPPPPNYGRQYEGTAQINAISRRSGGTWYRLTLQQPLLLTNLELRVLRANVMIHEASLVTDYRQRIPLYELTSTPVLGTGGHIGAYINRNERIVAIDIRAESFGDYADLLVRVESPEGYPALHVTPY